MAIYGHLWPFQTGYVSRFLICEVVFVYFLFQFGSFEKTANLPKWYRTKWYKANWILAKRYLAKGTSTSVKLTNCRFGQVGS